MNPVFSFFEYMRDHPIGIVFVTVGIVLVTTFLRGEDTRRDQKDIVVRVQKIESTSPCTNLTSSECALKLFRELPRETRRQLRVNQQVLNSLQRRAREQRRNLRRGTADLPVPAGAGGRSPGPSQGGNSPAPEQQGPGSSTEVPPSGGVVPPIATPAPTPAATAGPVIRTPEVQTPRIGPVPPIKVPPIEVPCIMTPLTPCK